MKILKMIIVRGLGAVFVLTLCISSCATPQNDSRQQLSPEDRMLRYREMGEKYYDRGDDKEAERAFMQVLVHNPEDIDVLYMLGVIYSRNGDFEKGRSKFMQVIEIDSYHSKAYYNLGALYANEGPYQNIEKASILFRRYLKLNPITPLRGKIENWLNQYGTQGQKTKRLNGLQSSEQPVNNNFKDWLKQQSESIE